MNGVRGRQCNKNNQQPTQQQQQQQPQQPQPQPQRQRQQQQQPPPQQQQHNKQPTATATATATAKTTTKTEAGLFACTPFTTSWIWAPCLAQCGKASELFTPARFCQKVLRWDPAFFSRYYSGDELSLLHGDLFIAK